MMLRLYVTPFSPQSEMARWALDAQGIPYVTVATVPIVGSPGLRLRVRKLRGEVRAPIAVKDGEVLGDAFAIARFGARKSLCSIVPTARLPAIGRWVERSDRMVRAGRLLTLERVRGDDSALREFVPKPVARLRRVGRAVGQGGAAWLQRRESRQLGGASPREALADDLSRLREALAGGDHLIDGAFSYADIAAACALQFVCPVGERWVRLGEANRPLWRDPDLAQTFADLCDWRDRLFERHREGRAVRPPLAPYQPLSEKCW